MKLTEGIREVINMFGVDIILSERFLNALSDFQAYDIPSARAILRTMVREKVTEQLLGRYLSRQAPDDAYLMSIVRRLTDLGIQRLPAQYVVGAMAHALGWTDVEPTYGVEEATPVLKSNVISIGDVQFTMCEVKGGRFSIGGTPEQGLYAAFDERPAVAVEVGDFMIGETPVTQQLWEAVTGDNPSHFKGADLPVERVTWEECQDFIVELNRLTGLRFRLPTEAEWEFAARGGTLTRATKYAGADDDRLDQYVWHKENSGGTTHPVKSKQPNELGIYDMCGNVGEWCNDRYFNSYAPSAGAVNPQGPASGATRVVRGGSYNDKPINCRLSRRNSQSPGLRNKQVGLRLALSL